MDKNYGQKLWTKIMDKNYICFILIANISLSLGNVCGDCCECCKNC